MNIKRFNYDGQGHRTIETLSQEDSDLGVTLYDILTLKGEDGEYKTDVLAVVYADGRTQEYERA